MPAGELALTPHPRPLAAQLVHELLHRALELRVVTGYSSRPSGDRPKMNGVTGIGEPGCGGSRHATTADRRRELDASRGVDGDLPHCRRVSDRSESRVVPQE